MLVVISLKPAPQIKLHSPSVTCVQVPLLGWGGGELPQLPACVGESRPVTSSRCRGETPPEADGEAARPRPVSRPAQESHAVWLPHRKDGGQSRKGLGQMCKTPHRVEKSLTTRTWKRNDLIEITHYKMLIDSHSSWCTVTDCWPWFHTFRWFVLLCLPSILLFFTWRNKSSVFPLNHVRFDIFKFFFEVKVTFNVRRQVSNIETSSNLMNVNRFPEGGKKQKSTLHRKEQNDWRSTKTLTLQQKLPWNEPRHKVSWSIFLFNRSLLWRCRGVRNYEN